VRTERLISLEAVLAEARAVRAGGASRFCMGATWRSPKDRDLDSVCAMVEGVGALALETCATLSMLTAAQARRLKDAGLDYYNHNLNSSPEFKIITTRSYQDRLETLAHVRAAGIHVCCGGIVGMGETREDRGGMIATLANLPVQPEFGTDQRVGPRREHAAGRRARPRSARVCAHRRRRPHPHAAIDGAALRRPRIYERRDAGAGLSSGSKFDFLRAEAADYAEPRARSLSRDATPRLSADALEYRAMAALFAVRSGARAAAVDQTV
jgi:hypothetical protein